MTTEWKLDATGYYKEKDPSDTLDYGHDWTDWLETTDVISTSTWVAEAGVTLSSPLITGKVTSTLIAGGIVGTRYLITNTVNCASGRIVQMSFGIVVKDK